MPKSIGQGPVLMFIYSYPYEEALLRLARKVGGKKYHKEALSKTRIVQKIWDRYEEEVLGLFRLIYKIRIPEKSIRVFVSLIAPNSFSNPFTISLKHWGDIENNSRSKRGFVYATIHELAHYFSYTRGEDSYFNKLHKKIQASNLLGKHGANLHYLIQAVEFGIVGEVFGYKYAEYSRNWVIDNRKDNEYGKSAKILKKHDVPLNKTCLEYIKTKILSATS